jgi:putative transposase
MKIWSRDRCIAENPSTELWPTVTLSEFSDSDAEKFIHASEAVSRYLRGERLRLIEQCTGHKASSVIKMTQRCIELCSDGQIYGFRALIPHLRIKHYERKSVVNMNSKAGRGGASGALNQLFERYPELEFELTRLITKADRKSNVYSNKLMGKSVHVFFIKYLLEHNHPSAEWPFNTKWRAFRTICTFAEKVKKSSFSSEVVNNEIGVARARLAVGTEYDTLLPFSEPYDAVEIDEHEIQGHFAVRVKTVEGTDTVVPLERLTLICVVCRASSAILAYKMIYSNSAPAADVVKVIQAAVTKRWAPMNITIPNVKYLPGAGLPNGVIPEAFEAVWSSTFFDGALAHLSKAVEDRARKLLGFAINWGAVAHFERRPHVEMVFRRINNLLFSQLPSSTGTSVANKPSKNSERQAVKLEIIAEEVEQILDVTVANYNVTPTKGLSYMSPMDFIRYYVSGDTSKVLLRHLPKTGKERAKVFPNVELKIVRGSIKTGTRPYVEVYGERYTNDVLSDSSKLIGKKLLLHIDEVTDLRFIQAYYEDGQEFGILKVKGRWSLSKHDLRTRKLINNELKNGAIRIGPMECPVTAYQRALALRRSSKQSTRQQPTKRENTEAARIANNSGQDLQLIPTASAPESAALPKTVTAVIGRAEIFFNKAQREMKIRNAR